jgi:hypothetical protein
MLLQQTGQALSLFNRELEHDFHLAIIEHANIGRVGCREKPFQGLALVQDRFSFVIFWLNPFGSHFFLMSLAPSIPLPILIAPDPGSKRV